ncbi:MAG: alpha/beta hydrolase, partial [Candidatus Promineifilaceae bacterium]|nr:alpha/beta hydrolase [Candidatus Promineifilaceae bacterium]
MNVSELWLQTANGVLYGREAGPDDGPLVLGVHGWSQRNGWHTWAPLLAPLGEAGFRAVSVDMPGWGQSEPWSSGRISPSEGAAVVLAILSSLQRDRVAIMGKSWGGGVALEAALEHESAVVGLILSAPAFGDESRLAQIQQPVLLVWAEDDPVIPFDRSHSMLRELPNAKLVSYPSGGHSAGPNNADNFAAKAASFL